MRKVYATLVPMNPNSFTIFILIIERSCSHRRTVFVQYHYSTNDTFFHGSHLFGINNAASKSAENIYLWILTFKFNLFLQYLRTSSENISTFLLFLFVVLRRILFINVPLLLPQSVIKTWFSSRLIMAWGLDRTFNIKLEIEKARFVP